MDILTKLSIFLTSPRKPRYVSHLFVFMLPPSSEAEVLDKAYELWRDGKADKVCFVDTGPGSGALGASHWKDLLMKRGMDREAILPISYTFPEGHINTLYEAISFAKFIQVKSLTTVGILCQSFHLLRAAMTLVSVLMEMKLRVTLHPYTSEVGYWHDTLVHSQGVVKGSRLDLIDSELERIRRYQEKGDIRPEDEVLSYFIS